MAKIRRRLRDLPIRTAFMLHMMAWLLLAVVISAGAIYWLQNLQRDIMNRYVEKLGEVWYISPFPEGVVFFSEGEYVPMDAMDNLAYQAMGVASSLTIPVVSVLCVVLAGIFFWRTKLKRPIDILREGARKIAQNDLDFQVRYDSEDEMGKLCAAFEGMRSALEQNHKETWRAMEERKRLNAAFSHDLRTPLTVLRGYADMLAEYLPKDKIPKDKMIATVSTMSGQIVRLENYVLAMNRLQKLEDIQPRMQRVRTLDFANLLQETGDIVCKEHGKLLELSDSCMESELRLDTELVMQVYENLIGNAVRFAEKRITVLCRTKNSVFTIVVMDDGPGFSKEGLQKAGNPFYKEKRDAYDSHFGLGLNICRVLCRKHDGNLKIGNCMPNKGARIQADFRMQDRECVDK